jgi:protein phosphatase PTC7
MLKYRRLWARLILHFWAMEMENDAERLRPPGEQYVPNPVEYLQKAYEQTIKATSEPNQWQGTTTAAGAQLSYQKTDSDPNAPATPLLYVTNLGDSQVLVIRPRDSEVIYKTKEQWHWFDCPRQLGTNSPDTPRDNAVMDKVPIEENDVVLAMSDGVIDNLWEHEIVENVVTSIQKWENGQGGVYAGDRYGGAGGGMKFVAEELMKAAKVIATDPFAESPFMEHAVEEGLAMEGGK